MSDLDRLAVSLNTLADRLDSPEVQHIVGGAGKRAAIEQIERAIGTDRTLSGWARRVRVGAGYDVGNPVVLNFRPKGMAVLVDQGRKRTGEIRPRRKRAVRVARGENGIRATSRYTRSRGHRLISKTLTNIPREIDRDLADGIDRIAGDVFR